MKKLAFTFFLILLTISSKSQKMPEAFLSLIPALPTNPCSITSDKRDEYVTKIATLKTLIDEEMDSCNNEMESSRDTYEQQVNAKAAKQYGLTAEELKKIQDSDGNEENQEEVDKLVNKAMMGKHNISMAEVDKMGKMSKEGQTAWAEAYSTEAMTDAQLNPGESKKM